MDLPPDEPTPFDTPESVLWNPASSMFFVSNIAGASDAADGIGWIAKLDADGNVLEPRWVEGLNAPKGMALSGGELYVADITELVRIDLASAQIVDRVPIQGAAFLNDVTASEERVWVSDTFGGAVFAFDPATDEVTELARDPMLATINGLQVDGDRILGGTFGDFMDPTDLGSFVSISLATGQVQVLAASTAKIDGIVANASGFLATDFRGTLLQVQADGTSVPLLDLAADFAMQSAADLGYDPDRNLVAIPDLLGSAVVFIDLDNP